MRPKLLAAAVAIAAVTGMACASPPDPGVYVALGDSYAAGVGTQADNGDACQRSPESYPALWELAHSATGFTSVACTGATTADVLDNQIGAVTSATTLVTVTVGGDDAGFTTVMTVCVLQGTAACQAAVDQAVTFISESLPSRLADLYAAIRAAAPAAKVVVLGYPRLFETADPCAGAPDRDSRVALNRGADALDAVTAEAASRAGFTFADVRDEFAGHGICTTGTPWIQGVVNPLSNSFHPLADGYSQGYLPVLNAVAEEA
ncbi:SGNH/GDSL hydrolase family protein [Amycolatopsis sp., V23-08]|uniref:SGNH/GDSL hydrolase family protein n=1 Tax=Amycolatopsis heterodermiae TaxID=3110235 RepID=A0ABU5R926_9PSEU|nr:SGNH/GDSL hydrolase family protein [Amycolatopsis sp., V23-08]MEA5362309.1 SGNH/GDSL hydrolase family protein [Amycolatopsis sp., V23-08]